MRLLQNFPKKQKFENFDPKEGMHHRKQLKSLVLKLFSCYMEIVRPKKSRNPTPSESTLRTSSESVTAQRRSRFRNRKKTRIC